MRTYIYTETIEQERMKRKKKLFKMCDTFHFQSKLSFTYLHNINLKYEIN